MDAGQYATKAYPQNTRRGGSAILSPQSLTSITASDRPGQISAVLPSGYELKHERFPAFLRLQIGDILYCVQIIRDIRGALHSDERHLRWHMIELGFGAHRIWFKSPASKLVRIHYDLEEVRGYRNIGGAPLLPCVEVRDVLDLICAHGAALPIPSACSCARARSKRDACFAGHFSAHV